MKNALWSFLILTVLLTGCDRYETFTCPFNASLYLRYKNKQSDSALFRMERFKKNSNFQALSYSDSFRLGALSLSNYGDTLFSYRVPNEKTAPADFTHFYNYDWKFTYLPTLQTYTISEVIPYFQHDQKVAGTTYMGDCKSLIDTFKIEGPPGISIRRFRFIEQIQLYF